MHLAECFAPLIARLVHFQRTARENAQTVEELRAEIDFLLGEGAEGAKRGGVDADSFEAARFAVCAWADEVILNSPWSHRDAWLKEELQRRYYGTVDAGEEFFERLKDLPLQDREARELYFLCLSLGFTGRYCGPGGEEALAQLKGVELRALSGTSSPELGDECDLFPGGYTQDLPETGKGETRFSLKTLPPLSTFCIPVLCFILLLVVFRLALTGMADNLLRSVPF